MNFHACYHQSFVIYDASTIFQLTWDDGSIGHGCHVNILQAHPQFSYSLSY